MKKNLLLNTLAIIVMLLTTACQKDDIINNNDKTTISFEVSTPEITTRAFSEGALIKNLKCAVYDSQHKLLQRPELQKTVNINHNGATKITLQLASGTGYYVLFWAAAEDAPYLVNFAEKTMTVDYSRTVCNNENRDAFYYYHKVEPSQKSGTVPITLNRPFAQLNIGTNDFTEATNNGVGYKYTQVSVNTYDVLNLVDGSVTGARNATFALGETPHSSYRFPVDEDNYNYLAMNYVLVGTETTTSDVVLYYGNDSNNLNTLTFSNIPMRRNHRTNIYGALLTTHNSSTSVTPPNP